MRAGTERSRFGLVGWALIVFGILLACGGAWFFWVPHGGGSVTVNAIPLAVENETNLLVRVEISNQRASAISFQIDGKGPGGLVEFSGSPDASRREYLGLFAGHSFTLDSGSAYTGKAAIPVRTNSFRVGVEVFQLSNGSRLFVHPGSRNYLGQFFHFLGQRDFQSSERVWSPYLVVSNWTQLGSNSLNRPTANSE